MNEFVQKFGYFIFEFVDLRVVLSLFCLQMFQFMFNYVWKLFKNEQLIKLLEFFVFFLGVIFEKILVLYSLMNYVDLVLGIWYLMGGMYKIVEGMISFVKEFGV